jgi:hypothetical protein
LIELRPASTVSTLRTKHVYSAPHLHIARNKEQNAKALLRMAAEHLVQADETLRITEPTDKPGVDRRRDPS